MATIAVRTRKSRKSDGIAFSEMSLRQNASVLEYCRTSISALSGATAGVMGLTSLWGFIFYFVTAAMLSVFLLLKAGSRWNTFFMTRTILFSNGLLGGLFENENNTLQTFLNGSNTDVFYDNVNIMPEQPKPAFLRVSLEYN